MVISAAPPFFNQLMRTRKLGQLIFIPLLLVACGGNQPSSTPTSAAAAARAGSGTNLDASGIHKIKHVVILMQENRSYDEYFGTYPGGDGLPIENGQFTSCVPGGTGQPCVRPFHDPSDVNGGGPHSASNATADINGGKMDGFVEQAGRGARGCSDPNNPACTNAQKGIDVMGYKDARDIPNYWAYAQNFTLQDHLFEPNASWSLPQHLYMVSG